MPKYSSEGIKIKRVNRTKKKLKLNNTTTHHPPISILMDIISMWKCVSYQPLVFLHMVQMKPLEMSGIWFYGIFQSLSRQCNSIEGKEEKERTQLKNTIKAAADVNETWTYFVNTKRTNQPTSHSSKLLVPFPIFKPMPWLKLPYLSCTVVKPKTGYATVVKLKIFH